MAAKFVPAQPKPSTQQKGGRGGNATRLGPVKGKQ